MSVRSYRLIIVEDSLALAAYYILRKLLEVKAEKNNFHLQLENACVYNRIELTVRTLKFSFLFTIISPVWRKPVKEFHG